MQQYIEWSKSTVDSYVQLAHTLKDYLPNLIGAIAFLILGWLFAHLARFIILKLGTALDKMISSFAKPLGFHHVKAHPYLPPIIANTVFWIIILFVLGTILRAMGWPGLLLLLHDYFPLLLGSILIILSAYIVSHLIAYLITQYSNIKEVKYAKTLAGVSKLIILSFAIIMAIEHLGFNMMLFKYLFLIMISCFLLGAALAFGIGARHVISHLLAMRNVRQYYQIGQVVKVGEVEGQVIDIKPHVIILQTKNGRAIVPGDIFYENITLLLESEKNA